MRWIRVAVAAGLVVTTAVLGQSGAAQAREQAPTLPSVWTESAYNSVFKDSGRSPEAADGIRLDTAKNDYEGAQIVLRGPASFTVNSVDFTPLAGASDTIPASEITYGRCGAGTGRPRQD